MTISADQIPAQFQDKQLAQESEMISKPVYDRDRYKGKVAIITGGDSGIRSSVGVLYAKEGANIALVYIDKHEDAQKTK